MYSQMFKGTNEMFKNYLKCSQLGTVRIEQEMTSPRIEGLCTDGMSACVGIIIFGENNKKLSLTHTDLAVHEDAVTNECVWVGSPCKMFIVRGTSYAQPGFEERANFRTKTMPRIQKAISEKNLVVEIDTETYSALTGALAVTRSGEIKIPTHNELGFNRIGQAAPDIELRHTINMINAYVLQANIQYHSLDIQYDSLQWTEKPTLTTLSLQQLEKYIKGFPVLSDQLKEELEIYLKIEKNIINEKKELLNQKTRSFFNKLAFAQKWKDYPVDKLTGKYIGHILQFFTMSADKAGDAKDFIKQLTQVGFDAELKTAKDKPSIVVDLTTSKLVHK